MQPQFPAQQPQSPTSAATSVKLTGWLLLVPAVILTVLTLVIPTVRTISTSLSSADLLGAGGPVGADNYEGLFDRLGFWSSLWFSLSLMLGPIIVAVIVAPLLSAAVSWAGTWARWVTRIVLSLTLVVFSPVALAIAWGRTFRDTPELLADPDLTGGSLRVSVAMMTFGVMCAVGVMIFLPVFRAREQRRPMWPALFTAAGVLTLGLLAVGLQLFTVPYVMTRFGPRDATMTPVGAMFTNAFQFGRLGVGAAVATVLLVLLAVLGVAAVLVLILTRFRVSLLPPRQRRSPAVGGTPPPAGDNAAAIVVAVFALLAVLVAVVLNARPWLDGLSGTAPESPPGAGRRTWVPATLGAMLSVLVAYLAALGISGLRPLGRHSEWLLLPFAPWLFVGVAPLSIAFFTSLRDDGGLDAESGPFPPILVSIVSLVVLALLCRGQSQRWKHQVAAGAPVAATFFRSVVVPTLPLAGLLFLLTTLINAQDLVWPLLSATSPDGSTTLLMLLRANFEFTGPEVSVASATPLFAVVLGFACLVAVQVFHLDRMVVGTGSAEEPAMHDAGAAPDAAGPARSDQPLYPYPRT
ncbi:MAG TPA: hypothetical protein VFV67_22135 [Actinophytocola sp.]|uniref:carbohydrate ABC transporter permease n=1 Tax=Actinophytocola sp. TaxID=1872138 RepID=UPI002DBD8D2C|nr:hypothetical protein [Actinophytocola sp.]HEU5473352.1 hypothetical protein [Actinophytocola sp.]